MPKYEAYIMGKSWTILADNVSDAIAKAKSIENEDKLTQELMNEVAYFEIEEILEEDKPG